MNQTVYAHFTDHQTAMQALRDAKQHFAIQQADCSGSSNVSAAVTMDVPPEKFADQTVGGISAPVYMTGPNTKASVTLDQSGDYTVALTADEQKSKTVALFLQARGGQNVKIR